MHMDMFIVHHFHGDLDRICAFCPQGFGGYNYQSWFGMTLIADIVPLLASAISFIYIAANSALLFFASCSINQGTATDHAIKFMVLMFHYAAPFHYHNSHSFGV